MDALRKITNVRQDNQEAKERAAVQELAAIKRQPMPRNASAWHALATPLAREHIEGERCRIIGKVFSWSPL